MESRSTRRQLLARTVAGAAVLSSPFASRADTFPSRPISLIVPYPPGGTTDAQFRALAQAAEVHLGQSVVILNKPGLGGALGPAQMAQLSPADGYTVSVLPASLYRLPHLQKVSWDPVRDFTYIIGLTSFTYGIVVSADSPWKTLADFIAAAKKNPGRITYASTGKATAGNIVMERLARAAGIQLNFVPYKGIAEWSLALVGGHIDAVSDPGWGALHKAGKVRVLATATPERSTSAPTIPSLKELGYPIEMISMLGIGGPKGMEPGVVKVLHDAFRKASMTPAYRKILQTENQPELQLDSAAFTRYAKEQVQRDGAAVKELKLILD